jgi:hypothetical protein
VRFNRTDPVFRDLACPNNLDRGSGDILVESPNNLGRGSGDILVESPNNLGRGSGDILVESWRNRTLIQESPH